MLRCLSRTGGFDCAVGEEFLSNHDFYAGTPIISGNQRKELCRLGSENQRVWDRENKSREPADETGRAARSRIGWGVV